MDGQHAIARRMVIGLPSGGLTPGWERDFSQFPPAGVIVFARDFRSLEDLRALTRKLRALARPRRLLIALDEEGGWVSQLAGHLVVPPNAAVLARGVQPGDLAWIAEITARRLRGLGFDWDFAPVADVASEPDNPVIGPRSYGSTAAAVADALRELLAGYRQGGIASCLKHYPGHGDTRVDSHLALPVCTRDRATLEARELAPFAARLAEADSVMTAHVVYPALDPDSPATFSRLIVSDWLRGRLGFMGVAITDALEMEAAAAGRTPAEAGRLSLEAGADLLLYATWDEAVRRTRLELADALVDGDIDRTHYEMSRPRLERFATRNPEPTDAELDAPLASLTPEEWTARLEAIVGRALVVDGVLPAAASGTAWRVDAPGFTHGEPLAATLASAGVRIADDGAVQLIAVCSRKPLADAEVSALRQRAAERPTVLVGLQNDAFLARVPEAAMRIAAGDATELTRRVVARRVAGTLARV